MKIRNIILGILALTVSLMILMVPETYAASATLSLSSSEVEAGKSAKASVSFTAAAWNLTVSGDKISGESYASQTSDLSETTTNKSFTIDTSTPGTYTITLSGDITDADGNTKEINTLKKIVVKEKSTKDENTGNTPQNTTEEPKVTPSQTKEEQTKSGEYHLKSLSTSVGTLKPSFNTYNQDYTLEFPADYDMSSLKSIDVSAAATDSKAKVSGTGSFEVKEGDNEIIVNCTAENGKVLAYRIKFKKEVKAQQSDLRLKTFSITKLRTEDNKQVMVKLNEEFKPDVFEYTMDVDENTNELNFDFEIDEKFKDKIDVKITGNKDLKPGENIITITLTSKDDEKITTTYTIKVKKAGEVAEEKPVENKSSGFNIKLIIIIVGSIVGLLVLILIILLIVNHIQKKKAKESMKADDDNNFVGGDNGFDADIGHDVRPVGVVEPDDEDSNYDFLSRDDELSDEVDDDDEKRFGGAGYNTLHQSYDPNDDEAGFDDTDLPEGTVSEHMINAKLNGEADELKKRYEVDELQEEIADELKDAKTKRKGRGRRFK